MSAGVRNGRVWRLFRRTLGFRLHVWHYCATPAQRRHRGLLAGAVAVALLTAVFLTLTAPAALLLPFGFCVLPYLFFTYIYW